jgi:hypothetical protein
MQVAELRLLSCLPGQTAELSAQKMARIPQDVVGRIVAEHKAHFHATG